MNQKIVAVRAAVLFTAAFLLHLGAVDAQTPDPYRAGRDVGFEAGEVYYLSGSPDDVTAYAQGGYAIYGAEFEQGFFDGFSEGYMMMGSENPYAGYFDFFKAWWDASQQTGDGAVQQIVVKRSANRVTRNFRRLNQRARTPFADGAVVKDVYLSADYTYASVEDNRIGGKGHDQEVALFLGGRIGDQLSWGLGIAHDRYDITSNNHGFEQTTDAIDAIFSCHATEHTSLGVFFNASFIDIEDEVLIGATIAGEQFERLGAGLLLSHSMDLNQQTNLGVTASLASLNKRSLERILDDEDTAAVLLIDLAHQLHDNVRLNVYGSYFGLIDRETTPDVLGASTPDGSYWTWGSDVSVNVTSNLIVALGYETTAADNDHEEHRLNLALTMGF